MDEKPAVLVEGLILPGNIGFTDRSTDLLPAAAAVCLYDAYHHGI